MHTLAWVAWVSLVMAVALTTNNPYYLAIVFLSVLLVAATSPKTSTAIAGFRTLLVFGLSLFAISMAIAVVNGTYGDHVVFTMPGPELPEWFGGLRLGGPVSAEGLVAAAIRGLAILTVLLAFGVFNGAVSPHRVLRTAPAALFHAGLVVTVGLTLLPATIEDARRIREMRALRGARTGSRELPALVVPIVINGLERSMRLAEAMEARGYAASAETRRASAAVGALSAPLLIGAAWGWYYYESSRPFALIAAVLGLATLAWWAWRASRATSVTRFRPEPLGLTDRLLVTASVIAISVTVIGAAGEWLSLKYNPFAGLPWPEFSPAGAAVALSCAWPALRLALAPARSASPAEAPMSPKAVRT
ncbi:MAG TPA: energy-coupling factor transporter transmembrane component T [Tepidiformaceae bacterium]|nr:energy-coupling factor transporter transmembrane component T [Tepidiformaceae bacterium]